MKELVWPGIDMTASQDVPQRSLLMRTSWVGALTASVTFVAACGAPKDSAAVPEPSGSSLEATPRADPTAIPTPTPTPLSIPAGTPSPRPADIVVLSGEEEAHAGFFSPVAPGFGLDDQGELTVLDDMSTRDSPGAVWTAMSFAGVWLPDGGELAVTTITDWFSDPLRMIVRIETVGGDDSIAVIRRDVVVEKVPDQPTWRVISFSVSHSCARGEPGPEEFGQETCL